MLSTFLRNTAPSDPWRSQPRQPPVSPHPTHTPHSSAPAPSLKQHQIQLLGANNNLYVGVSGSAPLLICALNFLVFVA